MRRERLDEDDLEIERRLSEEFPKPEKHKRCVATGKAIFSGQSDAAAIAKSMRARRNDPFVAPYHCLKCGGWHTGHVIGTARLKNDLEALS